MDNEPVEIKDLVKLVQSKYPQWKSFKNEEFRREEVLPLSAFLRRARKDLAENVLEALVAGNRPDDFRELIVKTFANSGLLSFGGPRRPGDLSFFYEKRLNRIELCRQIISLLHNRQTPAETRLANFIDFLDEQGVRAKWGLPTLLLFISDARREAPITPAMMQWFCGVMGQPRRYSPRPSAEYYARMKDLIVWFRGSLVEFKPAPGMVEIFAFIKLCFELNKTQEIIPPPVKKKGTAKDVYYWRIEPAGGEAEWSKCRTEGKIIFRKGKNVQNRRWLMGEEIRPGDQVLATQGRDMILGLGTFDGNTIERDEKNGLLSLPVKWEKTGVVKITQQTWQPGVEKIRKNQYQLLRKLFLEKIGVGQESAFEEAFFALLEKTTSDPNSQPPEKLIEAKGLRPAKELFSQVQDLLPQNMHERLDFTKDSAGALDLDSEAARKYGGEVFQALIAIGYWAHEAAMLYLRLDAKGLEYGFRIGNYGSEQRRRLLANCRLHLPALRAILAGRLDDSFDYSLKKIPNTMTPFSTIPDWQQWLENPGAGGFQIFAATSAHDAASLPRQTLVEKIASVFIHLYPLVLLAVADDPIPEIARHHGFIKPGGGNGAGEEEKAPSDKKKQTKEQCAKNTFLEQKTISQYLATIHRKKQVIIQGPPGTGKTFLAENLAQTLINNGDGFWELVQLHPAYSYEEFIQGLRPIKDEKGNLEYRVIPGRFLDICRRVQECTGDCVLILDEINRANLPQVFGELLYLLEYRNQEIPLAAGGRLHIPKNLLIIGTMNTADRSIALVDFALRRRFAFIELEPNYEILSQFHSKNKLNLNLKNIQSRMQTINQAINDKHFMIGMSYFLHPGIEELIENIWKTEIEPYIEECFIGREDDLPPYKWEEIKGEIMK